jgi:hypothetical protein
MFRVIGHDALVCCNAISSLYHSEQVAQLRLSEPTIGALISMYLRVCLSVAALPSSRQRTVQEPVIGMDSQLQIPTLFCFSSRISRIGPDTSLVQND